MALAPELAGFSRLITALDPWLDRVVIVGGWAHRLYHLHRSFTHTPGPALERGRARSLFTRSQQSPC